MNFTKMHGLGNDFAIFDYLGNKTIIDKEYWSDFSRSICSRGFGIGADGIVILSGEIQKPTMSIFNPDGSEAQMCGNAIRCVGKYLYECKHINQKEINIYTQAGIKKLKLSIEKDQVQSIIVNMGEPVLDSRLIPVNGKSRTIVGEKVKTPVGELNFTAVSTGNPHVVIFTNNSHESLVNNVGPYLEQHHYFPEGTNVEFVTINSSDTIFVSVWERGVGKTYACCTGACAALVASVLNDFTNNQVTAKLPGGELYLYWNRKTDNCVYMAGDAQFVYTGSLW